MTAINLPVSASAPAVPPSQRVYGPRLAGAWRWAALVAWALVWLGSLAAFAASTVIWFRWDSRPIAVSVAENPAIPLESRQQMTEYQQAIRDAGMTLPFYGSLFAGLRLLAGAPFFLLSALIARRRSDRLMAMLFAIVLAALGAAGRWISPNWNVLPGVYPWASTPVLLLGFLADNALIMLYTFPDGRFVPRWALGFAAAAVVINVLRAFFPDSPLNPDLLPGLLGSLPLRILIAAGLAAQWQRYRRSTDPVTHQQIKWVVAGASLLFVLYFAHYLVHDTPLNARIPWTQANVLLAQMALEPPWYVAQFAFALAVGVAVTRHRLWDIDLVINRVLVYGGLSLLTMGVYLAGVAAFSAVFQGMAGQVGFFLSTGLVAVVFEPLRRRLQRLVNRLMYGERDDPYAVLTRLSNMLEQAPAPAHVLPAIATTTGQALKLPYVAIHLEQAGDAPAAAAYGQPQPETVAFPIVYQAEPIGLLRAAPRARGERFSAEDTRLLSNIARQAGAAVQAARLHAELVRSRAEIVAAREEERRRLRRDLHDGLGPILASQTLKMAAARQLVSDHPQRAVSLVDDVIEQNQATVSELRRLVYGLRPPALDELGLVEAVRDLVRQGEPDASSAGGLTVTVEAPPEGLPALPAAVEAAAYRITLEALTNAARHAQASACAIRYACRPPSPNGPGALLVEIEDNGVGMSPQARRGVGLRSMRERAEEIGGALELRAAQPRGTLVQAHLPLTEWR